MEERTGIILSSVPGSGKTSHIVEIVKGAISEGVKSIYVVTFSREAAKELDDRIGDIPNRVNSELHISTIHSLAYSIGQENNNSNLSHGLEFYDGMIENAITILKNPKFDMEIDILACDEHQDINSKQVEFISELSKRAKHVIAVGDPMQCQPAGTNICLPNNESIDISAISKHTKVISGVPDKVGISRINNVSSRYSSEAIFNISTVSNETYCTAGHKWPVRWYPEMYNSKHVLILVQYGEDKSIHTMLFISKIVFNRNNMNFLHVIPYRKRMRIWVLCASFSIEELEHTANCINDEYGIKLGNVKSIKPLFPPSIDYYLLYKCLEIYGKNIMYPLFDTKYNTRISNNHVSNVAAVNLIPGYMHLFEYNGLIFIPTSFEIKREKYAGRVHSLDVKKYHTYVSDGILSCNSIYGFQGAYPNIMNQTEYLGDRLINREERFHSYRFGKNISKFVSDSFLGNNSITVDDKFDDVKVINVDNYDMIDTVDKLHADEDCNTGILFRTNKEIAQYLIHSKFKEQVNIVYPVMTYPLPAFCASVILIEKGVKVSMLISALSFLGMDQRKTREAIYSITPDTGMLTLNDIENSIDLIHGEAKMIIPPSESENVLSQKTCNKLYNIADTFRFFKQFTNASGTDSINELIRYIFSLDLVPYEFWYNENNIDEIVEAVHQYITMGSETMKVLDNNSNITVMTMHSSKGKEFDKVTVIANPFVNIYSDEEFRVLYVACTRARKELNVIIPEGYRDKTKRNVIDAMNIHGGLI